MTLENGRAISCGDHDKPTIIYFNGLTVSIKGCCKEDSVEGDITNGCIVISGANIVEAREGLVCLKPVNIEESVNDLNVIHSSMDERVLRVGNVLGEEFDLPVGLEHLENWIVYSVTNEGVPQVLEPCDCAPDKPVSRMDGIRHIEDLKSEGHAYARFWTDEDYIAITKSVLMSGFNDKAGLHTQDKNGVIPKYWGKESPSFRSNTVVAYCMLPRHGDDKKWVANNSSCFVRATQDVPELSRFVAPNYVM